MLFPKLSITVSSISLLLNLTALPLKVAAQDSPTGAWLEEETNWNEAGAEIPQAPTYDDENNLVNCEQSFRQATLPEDELVEAAGWTLTGSAQVFNGTTLITGMGNADGMCRPLDYQIFVFSEGEFAGTLSPVLMDSRTDGSVFNVELYGDDTVSTHFNRYNPNDALCCASGESRLFYNLDTEGEIPVLVPQLPTETYPSQYAQ